MDLIYALLRKRTMLRINAGRIVVFTHDLMVWQGQTKASSCVNVFAKLIGFHVLDLQGSSSSLYYCLHHMH